jgi:hypothetical protein
MPELGRVEGGGTDYREAAVLLETGKYEQTEVGAYSSFSVRTMTLERAPGRRSPFTTLLGTGLHRLVVLRPPTIRLHLVRQRSRSHACAPILVSSIVKRCSAIHTEVANSLASQSGSERPAPTKRFQSSTIADHSHCPLVGGRTISAPAHSEGLALIVSIVRRLTSIDLMDE